MTSGIMPCPGFTHLITDAKRADHGHRPSSLTESWHAAIFPRSRALLHRPQVTRSALSRQWLSMTEEPPNRAEPGLIAG